MRTALRYALHFVALIVACAFETWRAFCGVARVVCWAAGRCCFEAALFFNSFVGPSQLSGLDRAEEDMMSAPQQQELSALH